MSQLDELVTTACWAFVCAWLAASLPRGVAALRDPARRADALACAVTFAVALAVRLALGWGPVSFGEPERLDALWSPRPAPAEFFSAVPVLLGWLQSLGASATALLRVGGAVAGASGVAAVWLLARSAGVPRPHAAIGAAVALGWPSHLHYSTSMTFTVEGAALWTFAFAAACDGGRDLRLRPALVGALAVLGVYARPEFRLLLVPLAALALGPSWTWRSRAQAQRDAQRAEVDPPERAQRGVAQQPRHEVPRRA